MTRKNRRAAVPMPFLPVEIKLMIISHLVEDKDWPALRRLQLANKNMLSLVEPEVFKHVSLRRPFAGPSLDIMEEFLEFMDPVRASWLSSVSLRLLDNVKALESEMEVANTWNGCDYEDRWKQGHLQISSLLSNVIALDLTFDTDYLERWDYTEYSNFYLKWTKLQHLTVRADDSPEHQQTDNGELTEVAYCLASAFPALQTLRLLDADDRGLHPFRMWPLLPPIKCLQLDGRSSNTTLTLTSYQSHSSLTHLVISSGRDLMYEYGLQKLLLKTPNLESLAIRKFAYIGLTDVNTPPLLSTQLPRLRRVALDARNMQEHRLLAVLNTLPSIEILEIGSDLPGTAQWMASQIKNPKLWVGLKELGFVSEVVSSEDWAVLHEACDGAKIELIPGFSVDLDFPRVIL